MSLFILFSFRLSSSVSLFSCFIGCFDILINLSLSSSLSFLSLSSHLGNKSSSFFFEFGSICLLFLQKSLSLFKFFFGFFFFSLSKFKLCFLLSFLSNQISFFIKESLSFFSWFLHFLSQLVGQLLSFLNISLSRSNCLSSQSSKLLSLKFSLSLKSSFLSCLNTGFFFLSSFFQLCSTSFLGLLDSS